MGEKKGFGFCWLLFLLFIFFAAQQKTLLVAEARPRVCQSQSHGFRGPCVSDRNCALVCKNELFTGGDCGGLRRRCFCTKIC